MSKQKPVRYTTCTIRRTFERTPGTLNLATGKLTQGTPETVTEPCDTPLFSDLECATGVCKSCAKGWTHPKNHFASDEERDRAQRAHKAPAR